MAITDHVIKGYGQVELNHMSAQRTGQIYASLKLDTNVSVLQNGEFMYYDAADNLVTADTTTYTKASGLEPMLVYNEVKLYKDWSMQKDFAMIKDGFSNNYRTGDYTDNLSGDTFTGGYGIDKSKWTTSPTGADNPYGYRMDGFAPRLFKVNIGDIFTTNMIKTGSGTSYTVGDKLTPKYNSTTKTLQLEEDSAATANVYLVVKETTMADGQKAVKLQRIA